jgi:hypothetical protein
MIHDPPPHLRPFRGVVPKNVPEKKRSPALISLGMLSLLVGFAAFCRAVRVFFELWDSSGREGSIEVLVIATLVALYSMIVCYVLLAANNPTPRVTDQEAHEFDEFMAEWNARKRRRGR